MELGKLKQGNWRKDGKWDWRRRLNPKFEPRECKLRSRQPARRLSDFTAGRTHAVAPGRDRAADVS
jgi:hypothetical protein